MKKSFIVLVLLMIIGTAALSAQEGLIPAFELEANDLQLHRTARPGTPFDKVGRRFAVLGDESGSFEAWAYPLKLIRGFSFSFYIGSSTRPIPGKDIVRYVDVTPEATVLTYTFQSFTVKAVYITPVREPGALILLEIDSTEPLSVVCGFLPVLQPMWPAGIGGQFAYWSNDLKAYVISESSGKNHALVGSPAASGLSYTPAHMLSDSPSEFRIEIPDPVKLQGKYVPICLAGGKGKREAVLAVYKKLLEDPGEHYRENRRHFQELRRNTLNIRTPDRELDLAFEWAKVAFDNLIVDHPELGTGMVAGLGASGTSGRPGFGWFFGGDTYINSLSLSSFGAFESARAVLGFTRKWQREDGKMAHELSQAEGYIDWWNDYPYGYIHGDTSPYYIAAVYDYVRWSGDEEFVRESWDSLRRAYDWCLTTDANGDGLMDNGKAGLGALEYGALTGIATDIYLGAVWVRAAYAMQRLALIAGERDYSEKAGKDHSRASRAFEDRFWDADSRYYAYAFNAEGKHVKEISPWNAVGLMWGLGTPEHSRASLERISSSELITDWGVRSISLDSRYFQPLNYNYGAVWPFLTSWVTTALYSHHMPLNAWPLLKATSMHTFNHGLGSITEVFSGTNHVWPQEAVSHQGFSTAAVTLPLVRGLLGLEADASSRTLTFAPHLPAHWKKLQIDQIRVGRSRFSIDTIRAGDSIRIEVRPKDAEGYRLLLEPALGLGTEITDVTLRGESIAFETREQGQVTQAVCELPLHDEPAAVTVSFRPSVEIYPIVVPSRVGEANTGLKIVSLVKKDDGLTLTVEGLSGRMYEVGVVHPEKITGVTGGELHRDRIHIRIPEGKPGDFLRHTVLIRR
jgi:hypothetical protein